MTDQRVAVRDRSGPRPASHARRCVAPAALLVALAALASCSDNPSPEPLAEESASPSATRSPSGSPSGPPTLPPEARGTSDKAAIAFVEHVIDVLNYSAASLDTRPLLAISTPACRACRTITGSLADIKSNDGHVEGGKWRPLESVALETPHANQREIRVLVRYDKQMVVEAHGTKARRYPAGRSFFTFFVTTGNGSWKLVRIEGETS